MTEKPFFVIWNPDGGPPTVRHGTFADAQIEAKRLAKANPGHRFYVLAAVSFAQVRDPIEVVSLRPSLPRDAFLDDIPF